MKREADRARFAEILSRAGAQILLSRSDLTPLVIPEAATYSRATIATAVGGIPEMIKDSETEWLVPCNATAPEIGERLAEILGQFWKLVEAGNAAKEFCRQHWSWETEAKKSVSTMLATHDCQDS
jgi:glycosyltransferase involved in cell wall biosynthesis